MDKRVSEDQSRIPTLICGIQKLECWKREELRAERRGDRSDFVTSLRQQNSAIRCTVRMTAHAVELGVEADVGLRSLAASPLGCPDQDMHQAGVSLE